MKKRKILMSLIAILGIFTLVVPVLAQTPATVDGFFMAKAPTRAYDTNGVAYDLEYSYFGLDLTQEAETVGGYLYGFNASKVDGSKVKGGTSTYNATVSPRNTQNLVWGSNNVTVTAEGLLGVYLKSGCLGIATNGTGIMVGSPVSLVPGWNTLNMTTAGNITVAAWMDYTVLGEIFGTVGSSRLVLVGPDIVSWLDAGSATITGISSWGDNTTRVFAGEEAFAVTGNGTVTITLPYGSSGLVEGTSLTVNGGASYNLTIGGDEVVLSDAPGTLTVNIQVEEAYQFSARVSTSWWSGLTSLGGRLEGFLILATDPWNAEILSCALTAREYSYNPLLD